MNAARTYRLVVKVGTNTLTDTQGRLDRSFLIDLTSQLAFQKRQGRDVVLVTSGAIRAGREVLSAREAEDEARRGPGSSEAATPPGRDRSAATSAFSTPYSRTSLPYKQAAAAIGQGRLMHTYTEAFAWRNVDCAQVLLTREDLADRRRFLNARNTLLTLLALGVVPIINENDTVAVDEIKFGDNDNLAALVATLVEADLLLILSDVEGLYRRPPNEVASKGGEEGATATSEIGSDGESRAIDQTPISVVTRIDAAIMALAGGSGSSVGTGGMRTKLEAARIATQAGIRTVIARGRREQAIRDVVEGKAIGTTFLPQADADRLPARKRWIAHSARPRGSVTVDQRARERLQESGVSLLAVGILETTGAFSTGDLIEIRDEQGHAFARGLTNYSAADVRQVMGLHSELFEEILGYRGFEEIIHRDNLVIG